MLFSFDKPGAPDKFWGCMKPRLTPLAAAVAALALSAPVPVLHAQSTATTDPVGFVTVDTPVGSDTIIATPLTKAPVIQSAVDSRNGFTITLGSVFTNDLTGLPHYVQAKDGPQAGMIFDVASNTTNTITLVDNGVEPTGLANGVTLKVIPYWTLGQLYPASDQNVSFQPSGLLGPQRRTQILFPNIMGAGINRSASAVYYFATNASAPLDPSKSFWRVVGSTNNVDNTPILPDSYYIVRNPVNAMSGLKTTIVGSVNVNPMVVQLDSTGSTANDNYISLGRPMDIKLNDLGLIESGAFMASASVLGPVRRDQLMVINNEIIGINKSASVIYYYVTGQGWRQAGAGNVDVGNDIIKAATGYIIRKASQNPVGSQFWTNHISIAQ